MFNKNYKVFFITYILMLAFLSLVLAPFQLHAKVYALGNQPGTLDVTFDGDGLVTTSLSNFRSWGKATVIQPDGKIIVAGSNMITYLDTEFAVVRYNQDGSLDGTFDYDGIVTTKISGSTGIVDDVILQPDGKIVVVGTSSKSTDNPGGWTLMRLNPDGSPDTSFDGDGIVTTDMGDWASNVYAAAIQSDGKIVAVGFKDSVSPYDGYLKNDIILVRYNSNGSLDTAFGTNGIVINESAGGLSSAASSVVIQSDGKILIGGGINGWAALALIRYNTDGSLDTSFGSNGMVTINAAIASDPPQIALYNRKIILLSSSYFGRYYYLARFNMDGSLDTSFDSDGQVFNNFNYIISPATLAVQSNGKIIVAGSGVPTDNLDFLLIRYMPDGSLDTSFGTNGVVTTDFGTKQEDQAYDIAIQPNGKIILVGSDYNSTHDVIEVARYLGEKVIRYVKWNASGANNGTSWANAYTDLQSALAAASNSDEIWVAAGIYKPTTGTDRTISFMLKNGVAIYGGFAGTETLLSQRDYAKNVTILSGDIGAADDNSDNSYHVVVANSVDNNTIVDGFTITNGNANGVSPYNVGGGMYSDKGSLELNNIIFIDNDAAFNGGGLYSFYTDGQGQAVNLNLTGVVFNNNIAGGDGGGMSTLFYPFQSATFSVSLTDVIFTNNVSARTGGGMSNVECGLTLLDVTFSDNTALGGGGLSDISFPNGLSALTNVTFSNNSADEGGGGMLIGSDGGTPTTLTNVTFNHNSTAINGGGIVNAGYSDLILTNVTFSDNSASANGGGIFNGEFAAVKGGGTVNLINTTFSHNVSNTNGSAIYNEIGNVNIRNSVLYGDSGGEIAGTATVTNSIVQGGYSGTGNLNMDPKLGALADNGGFTQTLALLPGSPAIDAGNDASCPGDDQRGVKRPQGFHCDIGAYEYQP